MATYMSVFQKKRIQVLYQYALKKLFHMLNMCESAVKLPQYSILFELPQTGMLLPGHPGGVKECE